MSTKDFIVGKLQDIADKFKGILLKYAFEEITGFHIIEVAPEETRRGDSDYMKMESELWAEFHENYPNEDLLISEVCDDNDMSNIIYQTKEKEITNQLRDDVTTFEFNLTGNLGFNLTSEPYYNLAA